MLLHDHFAGKAPGLGFAGVSSHGAGGKGSFVGLLESYKHSVCLS